MTFNNLELYLPGNPIKILHLSPFNQAISGSDESLIDLIGSIAPSGVESMVALPKSSPYCGRYSRAGAALAQMPVASIRRTYNPARWVVIGLSIAVGAGNISKIIRSASIDLIHTNMETVPAGPIAARKSSIPNLVHVRSTSIKRPWWVFRRLVKFLVKYTDRAVAISDSVRNLMIEGGYPEERITRVYDPINTDIYRPRTREEIDLLFNEKFEPCGIEKGCKYIGLIGRLNPIKGQASFLEAAAMVSENTPEARFIMIGDAADHMERRYENELRSMTRSLGIEDRTYFLGHRPDIPELLPLLHISVSPSTTEAFGRPAAEAMSCGVPALVTHIDGLPEIVLDGQTGIIVPPDDPHSLADGMDKLLSDPEAASRMGTNGRKRVMENFSNGIHCKKMMELFQSLL